MVFCSSVLASPAFTLPTLITVLIAFFDRVKCALSCVPVGSDNVLRSDTVGFAFTVGCCAWGTVLLLFTNKLQLAHQNLGQSSITSRNFVSN